MKSHFPKDFYAWHLQISTIMIAQISRLICEVCHTRYRPVHASAPRFLYRFERGARGSVACGGGVVRHGSARGTPPPRRSCPACLRLTGGSQRWDRVTGERRGRRELAARTQRHRADLRSAPPSCPRAWMAPTTGGRATRRCCRSRVVVWFGQVPSARGATALPLALRIARRALPVRRLHEAAGLVNLFPPVLALHTNTHNRHLCPTPQCAHEHELEQTAAKIIPRISLPPLLSSSVCIDPATPRRSIPLLRLPLSLRSLQA